MNWSKQVLGLSTFISFCLFVVLWVLYPQIFWFWLPALIVAIILTIIMMLLGKNSIIAFFKRKSTYYGANLLLIVFLVLGIVGFVNYLARQHHIRWDMTKMAENSLSRQTKKILYSLEKDVLIQYFGPVDALQVQMQRLLERYKYESNNIHFELINPQQNPILTKSLEISKTNTAVFRFKNEDSRIVRVEGANSEEKITNGLMKLLKNQKQKVYFTVGHGERSLNEVKGGNGASELKKAIVNEVYEVAELNLAEVESIPKDADVIISIAPSTAFFPKEIEKLKAWLENGGRLMAALEVDLRYKGLPPGGKQIAVLLEDFGIQASDYLIIDPNSKKANAQAHELLVAADSPEHPITKEFFHQAMHNMGANFFFPLSTYFNELEVNPKEIKRIRIAKSSGSAWAESDWSEITNQKVRYTKGKDVRGELPLAYAVENLHNEAKIVAFSSANFIVNGALQFVGNKDLFLNSLSWITDQDSFISIRSKQQQDKMIDLGQAWINLVFLFVVIIFPVAIFSTGVWVWYGRRRL